jgi:hypothetical protein
MAFLEIIGQLLHNKKWADGIQGINVICSWPFDHAANASNSPLPWHFQNFFYEWCAVAVFRQAYQQNSLTLYIKLCSSYAVHT